MQIFVENKILRKLAHNPSEIAKYPFISDVKHPLIFGWPSLLASLDLEGIFKAIPEFDQTNKLFEACILTLSSNVDKEVLFYLYDRLFAECLTRIKNLPQMDPAFLLNEIAEKRLKLSYSNSESLFSPLLNLYEKLLQHDPSNMMHDLILYLAWDRMCVCTASLFDYQSVDPNFLTGLEVLKDCLIESYQHISRQGRISPGFYRLTESLFFYQMRGENIEKHTETEWDVLSQSFNVLKGKDDLIDLFYIDAAVISEGKLKGGEGDLACYFTGDSPPIVKSRLALAHLMMNKLKREIPGWHHVLCHGEIVCLSDSEEGEITIFEQ